MAIVHAEDGLPPRKVLVIVTVGGATNSGGSTLSSTKLTSATSPVPTTAISSSPTRPLRPPSTRPASTRPLSTRPPSTCPPSTRPSDAKARCLCSQLLDGRGRPPAVITSSRYLSKVAASPCSPLHEILSSRLSPDLAGWTPLRGFLSRPMDRERYRLQEHRYEDLALSGAADV